MLFVPHVIVGGEGVQTSTPTVVVFTPHKVAVQLFPAEAATGVHEPVTVGPVVIGAGHVVVVQLLPALAAAAVHVATGTFVVTTGGGHVVVV